MQSKVRENLYMGKYYENYEQTREEYAMYKIGKARFLEPMMADVDIIKYIARHFGDDIRDVIAIQGTQEEDKLLKYLRRIDEIKPVKRNRFSRYNHMEFRREGGREQRNGDIQNVTYPEQYEKNMKRTGEYEQRTRNWREYGQRQERRYGNVERRQGFVPQQKKWVEHRQDRRQEVRNEQGQRKPENTDRVYHNQNLLLEERNNATETRENRREVVKKVTKQLNEMQENSRATNNLIEDYECLKAQDQDSIGANELLKKEVGVIEKLKEDINHLKQGNISSKEDAEADVKIKLNETRASYEILLRKVKEDDEVVLDITRRELSETQLHCNDLT